MWSSEGTLRQQAGRRFEQPADRVDGRGGQRFIEGRWRQDAGQTPGEQGFAGAGRTDKQQVVPSGGSNLERPPRTPLAPDVDEVERGASGPGNASFRLGTRDFCATGQIGYDLRQ